MAKSSLKVVMEKKRQPYTYMMVYFTGKNREHWKCAIKNSLWLTAKF
jgi:hypothetical protein